MWFYSTSPTALIVFKSIKDSSIGHPGGFRLSFFSDGPNYHCGFSLNPAEINGPSFLFTDGTAAEESMLASQNCEWRINPIKNSLIGSNLVFVHFNKRNGCFGKYKN